LRNYGKTIFTEGSQVKIQTARLKICGITRQEDLNACCAEGVPFVGFNFSKVSKRWIDPRLAAELWAKRTPGPSQAVAVLVNHALVDISQILTVFPDLKVLQFHGRESPGDVGIAREEFRQCQIWKAIPVREASDMAAAVKFSSSCDLILYDTKTKTGEFGGSGEKFDWSLLAAHRGKPWGIAGGIKPEDVSAARDLGAWLIDVCSGVETSPGVKDQVLIAEAVKMWRSP
jgi:phosphoribosylanthranilate isomerase